MGRFVEATVHYYRVFPLWLLRVGFVSVGA